MLVIASGASVRLQSSVGSDGLMYFGASGAYDEYYIGKRYSGNFTISNSGGDRLTLLTGGNIGIGTWGTGQYS